MTLADTSTKRPQSFHLAAITVVRKIVLISKDGFFVSGNDYSAGIFVERNSITGQVVQAVDFTCATSGLLASRALSHCVLGIDP